MKRILPLAALAVAILLPGAAEAETYRFTGPDFVTTFGDNFSTSDSITGTLTISNPPAGGTCNGLGDGPGQCDITELTLTASGVVPLTLNLDTADIDPTSDLANPDLSLTPLWALTFDAENNITNWALQLQSENGTKRILVNFPLSLILSDIGTLASVFGSTPSGEGRTPEIESGFWTLIPEPSSTALLVVALLRGVRAPRRRT